MQRTEQQSKIKGDCSYGEGNSKRNEGAFFSTLFQILVSSVYFFFLILLSKGGGGKKKSADMLSLTRLTHKVEYGNKTLIPTLAYSQHVNSSKSLQFFYHQIAF